MVGPYRLLAELGRGGMGTVYRAVRADGELSRELALKVAGDLVFAPEAQRRFIEEREILGGLDHPHIVRLVDGGVAAGRRYLVMELAEGPPITTYCMDRRLPVAERVRLFRQVCQAIEHAHQRLILHRDIKPGNVIVLPGGHVRVLDFGIAQVVRAESLTTDPRTVLHPMSLACASPEQLRGEPLSLASDIYSLGTLLYEVLTGANPQARPGISVEEAMRLVLHDTPARPSLVNPAVPRDLDAVTLKALARTPADRYRSVSELDADLARWLDGRPVTAVPPSAWYVFSRAVRRHRVAAATAALALIGILTALGVAVVQYRQAERARATAEARFAEVRRLANSLIFELDDVVRTRSTTEARQRIVADALQYLDRLAAEAPDPALRLELAQGCLRVAQIQGNPNEADLGNADRAMASARKALTILEPLATGPAAAPDTAPALESLVTANRLLSTIVPPDERLRYARAALAAARTRVAVSRTDEARFALAAAEFALAAQLPDPAERRQHFEAAGREFETLLAERPDDPGRMRNVALVDKNLTGPLAVAREFGEARRRAERAVALDARRVALNPNDRQARLDAAISYAQLATRRPDGPEQLAHYEKSLQLREQVAREDPSNRLSRMLLGRSLAQAARARLRAGDAAGAREAALRFLREFLDDTGGPSGQTARQWRGWACLVAATTDGRLGRQAEGCTRLRLALEDLAAAAASPELPMPKGDIAVARAVLPACAATADAATAPPG